jgi:hypothetical protein
MRRPANVGPRTGDRTEAFFRPLAKRAVPSMAAVARASFALPPVRLEAKIWRIMFCTWRLAHPGFAHPSYAPTHLAGRPMQNPHRGRKRTMGARLDA